MNNQEFSNIIANIYDATLDETLWPELLNKVSDYCGIENTAIVTIDAKSKYTNVFAPRADPHLIQTFNEYWWQKDPTLEPITRRAVGELTSLQNGCGRKSFLQSEFYNDYWKYSDFGIERISSNLIVSDQTFSNIVFQASKSNDHINDTNERKIQEIIPHLIRAQNILQVYRELEFSQYTRLFRAGKTVGTIFVDRNSRIIYADEQSSKLLAQANCVIETAGYLSLLETNFDLQLKKAISALDRRYSQTEFLCNTQIVVAESDINHPFTIKVLPYHANPKNPYGTAAVAMVLIEDKTKQRKTEIQMLRKHLGFTNAEALLAREMMKGDGRAAAAERCGISVNTARTHLSRIFEKTGVNRQAELLRTLIGIIGD